MDQIEPPNADTGQAGGAAAHSGLSAEEELAKLKQEKADREFRDKFTKSGWNLIKSNFRWSVFLALSSSLFFMFIINAINTHSLEYGLVLFTFGLVSFSAHNLSQVRQKLSLFHYLDDASKIESSPLAKTTFLTKDQVVEKLMEWDKTNIGAQSTGAAVGAGIALFSTFCTLEAAKPLWLTGVAHFSTWDYVHTLNGIVWFLLVTGCAVYGSYKTARDFKKLTKSLRVYSFD